MRIVLRGIAILTTMLAIIIYCLIGRKLVASQLYVQRIVQRNNFGSRPNFRKLEPTYA
jgi:hypothetical protein